MCLFLCVIDLLLLSAKGHFSSAHVRWLSMFPLIDRGMPLPEEVRALFDVVVESAVLGVRKPDPRIFQDALQRIGSVAAR